ncbi:DUF2634 domain-containing protein [Paenibacillus campinasensis]|uniref:DUF2634 domain-containing protein n=1 Tax=Paenibacillus campinasensis TaxID=66347 RepID=A0A268EKP7_9BACL|nr:DUF2634 domain-containing protein [Paenibacillus campinasensis]PAD73664.1 DUF2634 domain-containing protein [Paenibacillus campinasensis]
MISLKVDQSGDLVFAGGEMVTIEGPEELAQCCRLGIGTNKNEWFLNPDMGINFKLFLGKEIDEAQMRDELTAGLLQESRIQSVENVEFTINRKSRTMLVTFTATGINGETIQEGVEIGAG